MVSFAPTIINKSDMARFPKLIEIVSFSISRILAMLDEDIRSRHFEF